MVRIPKKITEAPVLEVSKKNRTLPIIMVLSVLLLLSLGVAGYFYYQFTHTAQKNAEREMQSIVNELGKFIVLPEGEPTLATVTDKAKLASDQPFFKKAENGDKVLIYTTGGKAILYRPSQNKIIDITAINVKDDKVVNTDGDTSPKDIAPVVAAAAAPSPVEAPVAVETTPIPINTTVALYNGTMKIGVTNTLEDDIVAKFPTVVVEKKEKAAKSDYKETQVIDLSGKNTDLAAKVAEAIGGKVIAALPEGEVNPSTDILVIVGQK